jgi:hypothetical protein
MFSRSQVIGLLLVATAGWGLSWAVGFFLAYRFQPTIGWAVIGAAGGLATALMLRLARQSFRVMEVLAVFISWSAGGVISAMIAEYDILIGWIMMATLGGAITGAAMLGRSSSTVPIPAIAVALGWISGGVIGALFASIACPIIAPLLGWFSSGSNRAWLMCWGIAGGITGAIGGSVSLWQLTLIRAARRRRPQMF